MLKKPWNWKKILFIIGIVMLVLGIFDPLEGSVLILAGSIFMSVAAFLRHDRHRTWFFVGAIAILIGVAFMFYFSSLGGFGGDSSLSWWWALLILPYPMGWVLDIVILIIRVKLKPGLNN